MESFRMETPANMDEIRAILQEAVQSRGTQRGLAEHMGITDVHVSRLLAGSSGITIPNLFKILDYAGMTLILAGANED